MHQTESIFLFLYASGIFAGVGGGVEVLSVNNKAIR